MSNNPTNNPYNTPQQTFGDPLKQNVGDRMPGLNMVNQITIVAIFMFIQGVLLMMMTALVFAYAFGLPALIRANPGNNPQQDLPEEVLTIITTAGAIIGTFTLLLALMHFLAGYWAINFKGRIFGITTMLLGLAASMTFYCAPTAIGLAVYGLIVYFNASVREAFRLRESGVEKSQIFHRFY